MDEPSPLAREHTRLLRRSVEPPGGTRERNWEQLGSALDFAEAAAVESAPWLSAHAIKVFAITVGVGTLGLVGVDLMVGPQADPPAPPPIEHVEPAVEARPSPPTPPAAADLVPPPRAQTPTPTRAVPRPAKPSDPLAAELALVEQIRQAYRAADLTRAADLAEGHRSRFPTGVFAPERDAILAEHACASGDKRAAEEFSRRHESSPLATRVAAACDAS